MHSRTPPHRERGRHACVCDAKREGRLRSLRDLQEAVLHGAVKRIRPKFMTVATMFMGLVPIMWSVGAGADVMKRIAAPVIGGILTSFILELVVYPAIYEVWRWHFGLKRELAAAPLMKGGSLPDVGH